MKILDKYIYSSIIKNFIITTFFIIFIWLIMDIFSNISELLKNKNAFFSILNNYSLIIPYIFLKISPLSFLLSSLFFINYLNKHNEIISLKIQGQNNFNIVKKFLLIGFILSLLNLGIENKFGQYFKTSIKTNKTSITQKNKENIKNFYFYNKSGHIIFAKEFDTKNIIMYNAIIFLTDDKNNFNSEIISEKIIFLNNKWIAYNGIVYKLENFIPSKNINTEKEIILPFTDTIKEILQSNQILERQNFKKIFQNLKNLNQWKAKKIYNQILIELNRRIAENFSPIFLILIALGFALKINPRKKSFQALGLTLLFGFIYFILFSVLITISKLGIIPYFSCWLPNILYGIIGIYQLKK